MGFCPGQNNTGEIMVEDIWWGQTQGKNQLHTKANHWAQPPAVLAFSASSTVSQSNLPAEDEPGVEQVSQVVIWGGNVASSWEG